MNLSLVHHFSFLEPRFIYTYPGDWENLTNLLVKMLRPSHPAITIWPFVKLTQILLHPLFKARHKSKSKLEFSSFLAIYPVYLLTITPCNSYRWHQFCATHSHIKSFLLHKQKLTLYDTCL